MFFFYHAEFQDSNKLWTMKFMGEPVLQLNQVNPTQLVVLSNSIRHQCYISANN